VVSGEGITRAPGRCWGAGDLRGWILGVGTSSGTLVVVGHWPRSPFGPLSDVMVQHPDGNRLLLAPQPEVAEFIAATYTLDRGVYRVTAGVAHLRNRGAAWCRSAAAMPRRQDYRLT
jgi:hypothetical protein